MAPVRVHLVDLVDLVVDMFGAEVGRQHPVLRGRVLVAVTPSMAKLRATDGLKQWLPEIDGPRARPTLFGRP